MSKLPNYDALRDPHCTYTRKRQFRIHHERYKQVAVMSEILRGDHGFKRRIRTSYGYTKG